MKIIDKEFQLNKLTKNKGNNSQEIKIKLWIQTMNKLEKQIIKWNENNEKMKYT